MKNHTRRQALTASAATLAAPWIHAQTPWPAKPVTVVVPFPPGGSADHIKGGRLKALGNDELKAAWKRRAEVVKASGAKLD